MCKLIVINTGQVGKTLAYLFNKHLSVTVHNRNKVDAFNSGLFVGTEYIADEDLLKNLKLEKSDIIFIASSDDYIQTSCKIFHDLNIIKKGIVVFHASGTLSSEILASLSKQGAHIASVHPIKSFADPAQAIQSFPNTFCAIEGDHEAIERLSTLFNKIGAQLFNINKAYKLKYHAACVVASNYCITLCAEQSQLDFNALRDYLEQLKQTRQSVRLDPFEKNLSKLFENAVILFEQSGIESNTARCITHSLMQGTINNLEEICDPRKALTGPLQRGDIKTIQLHLDNLDNPIKNYYATFGLKTLPLTSLRNNEKNRLQEKFEHALVSKHVS